MDKIRKEFGITDQDRFEDWFISYFGINKIKDMGDYSVGLTHDFWECYTSRDEEIKKLRDVIDDASKILYTDVPEDKIIARNMLRKALEE